MGLGGPCQKGDPLAPEFLTLYADFRPNFEKFPDKHLIWWHFFQTNTTYIDIFVKNILSKSIFGP